ncbi:MAG: T9SS type A sorting domain-containing protein [candidate division Zixibacteria bacterium]|nr:T9SS type A sorting domain-containing protein [candidate division Zixibacteria bacterium]
MKKLIIFLVLGIVVLLSGLSYSQRLEYIGSALWYEINDIQRVGDYGIGAFRNGLIIYDFTNFSNIEILDHLYLYGKIEEFTISGDYLYAAAGDQGLLIINIADMSNPILVGVFSTQDYLNSVFVRDNIAYLAPANFTLQVVDVSAPTSPELIASLDGDSRHVYVDGNYAFISGDNVKIVDISNSYNPNIISEYDSYAFSTTTHENYLMVAGVRGVELIDITEITNPIFLDRYNMYEDEYGYSTASQALLFDDYIFAGFFGDGLAILTFPELEVVDIKLSQTYRISLWEHFMFFVAPGSGFDIYDVSDPWNITRITTYGSNDNCWDVCVRNGYAYCIDYGYRGHSGLKIFDISNPNAPLQVGFYDHSRHKLISIEGNYAHVAGNGEALIIDISNPLNPIEIYPFYIWQESINDIHVEFNYSYVTIRDEGLRIYDVSDPSNVDLIGSCSTPNDPLGVFVCGDYAYIADAQSGLQIINISDPEAPYVEGNYNTPGEARSVFVRHNYAYIADYWSGMQIIDIDDPANPILVSSYDMPGTAVDIYVEDDHVFIANGSHGVYAVDVSNPYEPSLIASLNTPGNTKRIHVQEDTIYVADEFSFSIFFLNPQTGIEEVATIPTTFSLSPNYPNPFNASTTINYALPYPGQVKLDIYDILGRQITTLIDESQAAGEKSIIWAGQTNDGNPVSSGVYFYRLTTGDEVFSERMTLIK